MKSANITDAPRLVNALDLGLFAYVEDQDPARLLVARFQAASLLLAIKHEIKRIGLDEAVETADSLAEHIRKIT